MAERRKSRDGVVPGLADVDPRQFIVPDPCSESTIPHMPAPDHGGRGAAPSQWNMIWNAMNKLSPAERRNWAEVRRILHQINQGDNILNERGDIDVNYAQFVDARVTNNFNALNSYLTNAYITNLYQYNGGGTGYTILSQRSYIRFTITALNWDGNTNWVTATPDYFWEGQRPNGLGFASASPVDLGNAAQTVGILIPPGLWPNRAVGDIGLARVLGSLDDRIEASPYLATGRYLVAVYIKETPAATFKYRVTYTGTFTVDAVEAEMRTAVYTESGNTGSSYMVPTTQGLEFEQAGTFDVEFDITTIYTLQDGDNQAVYYRIEQWNGSSWTGLRTIYDGNTPGVTGGFVYRTVGGSVAVTAAVGDRLRLMGANTSGTPRTIATNTTFTVTK